MNTVPQVSIVIPVFNAGKHLVDALGSMVDQTFPDWEMICVNDGSTDASPSILDWFSKQDNRIRWITQPNSGIVSALNAGCNLAKGAFFCRMDGDDIAMPDRLELQVAFMRDHPEVVAVGGAILSMDSDSQPLGVQSIAHDHDTIVENLLNRRTGLFHPASLIRSEAFKLVGGYRPEYQWVEDHDLWLRLSQIGKLANMDEIVLCYRQHASSVCWQRSQTQRELMTHLIREARSNLGMPPSTELSQPAMARTKANPGKWARMAARGGYPGTAIKHLRQLVREQGLTPYCLRMFAEVCLRAPLASLQLRSKSRKAFVPNLAHWHSQSA